MNIDELFKNWRKFAVEDDDVANELEAIKNDKKEIYERFYRDLSFGTAGLRGILGAGTNRMNVYTVRRATQGFSQYLIKNFENPSVAIAFDSRIKSDYLSREAAAVFAANDITVYMYDHLMPTPMLSFCIRRLGCSGGVNITASHNPAKYNGYKAYRPDGCQISEEEADAIVSEIENIDTFDDVVTMDFDEALEDELVKFISEDISQEYYEKTVNSSIDKNAFYENNLNVVYTPLCGAGNIPVRTVLKMAGFNNLTVVKEQEMPDGNFKSCPYPNPEFREALMPGIKCAKEQNAEMLIATDPDSDRLGVVLFKENNEVQLTGNQVGILMTYYMLEALKEQGRLPQNPLIIKSVVTSPIIEKIASDYNGTVYVTLTGFKNICKKMAEIENEGRLDDFVFAFEESCGYLPVNFVRDKDGVASCLLMTEMACHYKKQGKTLIDVLDEIYEKYGYHREEQLSFVFEGAENAQKLNHLVENLFINPPKELADYKVLSYTDLKNSITVTDGKTENFDFPKSNVLILHLENDIKVTIRPSGTEPKLKTYIMVNGENSDITAKICENIKKALNSMILL